MTWRGLFSSWVASRRPLRDDTPATTCVVFSVPEKSLREMNVATGPCVPLPGRKRALRGVLWQDGPETPKQMRALFDVLGGAHSERKSALELIATSGPGSLYRCSEEFVTLMRRENEEAVRLSNLDEANGDKGYRLFVANREKLDAAWLKAGEWHRSLVGTGNKFGRLGWARIAQEKDQPLYCWYGPPVPEFVVVSGSGPYPGKTR